MKRKQNKKILSNVQLSALTCHRCHEYIEGEYKTKMLVHLNNKNYVTE